MTKHIGKGRVTLGALRRGVGVGVYSLLGVGTVVWCLCGAYLVVVYTRVVAGGVAFRCLFGQSWFVLIGLFILRFLDDFVW